MNDRFKFRVWDKKYNEIMAWESFKEEREPELNYNPPTKELWVEFDESRYILMQSTGLKDRNGKLIYESDIVKHNEMVCDIVFYDYSFMAHIWRMDDIVPLTELTDDFEKCPFEVIGNIFENPELIGGAE